jgi:RP/EB family microtubule-associated protein
MTYQIGKGSLVSWINSTLQLTYTCLEECADGAAACQIMDNIKPMSAFGRVKFGAVTTPDILNNYKILQEYFD